MPKVGFEPTRAFAHYALNVARLPIPPLRPSVSAWRVRYFTLKSAFVNLQLVGILHLLSPTGISGLISFGDTVL